MEPERRLLAQQGLGSKIGRLRKLPKIILLKTSPGGGLNPADTSYIYAGRYKKSVELSYLSSMKRLLTSFFLISLSSISLAAPITFYDLN